MMTFSGLTHSLKLTSFTIRCYAFLLSIVLSLIALQTHDPINLDGIIYLRAAAAYLDGGLTAAFKIYNWPFYSILIAKFSQLTHLSLMHSAQLISTILIGVIVVAFISLVRELGGKLSIQVIAAIVILIYPTLAHKRDYIVRDFGYWAFLLLGLLQLLRFAHTPRWRYVISWGMLLAIATLFRIEGMIIWLALPLVLLLHNAYSLKQRIGLVLKIQTLLLLGGVSLLLLLTQQGYLIEKLGRIPELLQQIKSGWQLSITHFYDKANLLREAILNNDSRDSAAIILLGGILAITIFSLITTLTLLYSLLVGYALAKQTLPTTAINYKILIGFIGLNLLIILLFVSQHYFLSDRYVVALCLVLQLWVPFALAAIYQEWCGLSRSSTIKHGVFLIIILWLLALAVGDVVRFGYSKAYITDAAAWLRQNTVATANVYSNSKEIAFYAERPGTDWDNDFNFDQPFNKIYKGSWHKYNYIALLIKHGQITEQPKLIQRLGKQPIQQFQNKRGDKVLIFEIKKPS